MLNEPEAAGLILDRFNIPYCTFDEGGSILYGNTAFAGIRKLSGNKQNLYDLFQDSERLKESSGSYCNLDLKTAGSDLSEKYVYRVFISSGSALFIDITETVLFERMTWDALEKASLATAVYTRFFSNINHEIRTPLNSVMGLTELLLESVTDREHTAKLRKIQLASVQLLQAVEDLLDIREINEPSAGKINETVFSLDHLLNDTLSVIVSGLNTSFTVFSVYRDPEIPDLLAGPEEAVRRILRILAGNAVKYTPSGSIKITVTLQNDGFLAFSVRDTGPGIPESYVKDLFSGDFDGKISPRRYNPGDPGLNLARKFAENSGGNISVQSDSAGTEFSFRIPVKPEPAESDSLQFLRNEQPSVRLWTDNTEILETVKGYFEHAGVRCRTFSENEAGEIPHPDIFIFVNPDSVYEEKIRQCSDTGIPVIVWFTNPFAAEIYPENQISGFLLPEKLYSIIHSVLLNEFRSALPEFTQTRALIAEDNMVNQEVLRGILERRGISVVCAETGEAAVRILAESDGLFDIVFMDLQMPGMDGTEAAREIRRSSLKSSGILIIALTANTSEEDRIRSLAAGMDAFLKKPVNPRKILEMIADLLPHKRTGTDSRRNIKVSALAETAGIRTQKFRNQEINLEEGLSRALGDRELFAKILEQFILSFGDFGEKMRAGLSSGADPEGSVRLAHSLKGVAANLGLHEVHEWARHLEMVLREKESGDPVIITDTMDELLQKNILIIREWLKTDLQEPERLNEKPEAVTKEFLHHLRRISEFSGMNDTEALKIYQAAATAGIPERLKADWKRLGESLSKYDFITASLNADRLMETAEQIIE